VWYWVRTTYVYVAEESKTRVFGYFIEFMGTVLSKRTNERAV
jgi:hypothetical protein